MKLMLSILINMVGWVLLVGNLTSKFDFGYMPTALFICSAIFILIPFKESQSFTGVGVNQ